MIYKEIEQEIKNIKDLAVLLYQNEEGKLIIKGYATKGTGNEPVAEKLVRILNDIIKR